MDKGKYFVLLFTDLKKKFENLATECEDVVSFLNAYQNIYNCRRGSK